MARVRPFAGWRYLSSEIDISTLVAPPYDVITPEQRAQFIAGNPLNVVALELPEGSSDPSDPTSRYAAARDTWSAWRETNVLGRDDAPLYYLLEQSYEIDGRAIRRRALIAEVGLEPFSAGIVVPHERTLPKALGDRFELIKATGANFSQVFGLFEDPDLDSEALLDEAHNRAPIVATATDEAGVISVLRAIGEPSLIERFTNVLGSGRIFIADGHHRYTTALAYRDSVRASDRLSQGDAHEYVMMALVGMSDPDLLVLPTHRVADSLGEFQSEQFLAGLRAHFELTETAPESIAGALDAQAGSGFGVKMRGDDRVFRAELRRDADLDSAMPAGSSAAWRALDVAVLQELVLRPLLGIHPDEPHTLERLNFVKDRDEALAATGGHDVAFILRSTRMEDLAVVASGGEIMPQKSTYFYPKLPSGLVFRSARD